MPFDGLLGIGPAEGITQQKQSFTKYLFDNGSITNHTVLITHDGKGNKEIEFGGFGHNGALIRYHMEQVHENLKTMRFDVSQVNMGNYSFPTHLGNINDTSNFSTPEDPKWIRANLIIGSDPFITFETPFPEDVSEYLAYMGFVYPEISLIRTTNRFGHTVIVGLTKKQKCSKVTLQNPL